jgi:hypothetical protein
MKSSNAVFRPQLLPGLERLGLAPPNFREHTGTCIELKRYNLDGQQ